MKSKSTGFRAIVLFEEERRGGNAGAARKLGILYTKESDRSTTKESARRRVAAEMPRLLATWTLCTRKASVLCMVANHKVIVSMALIGSSSFVFQPA